jgi:NAD(P)-dependent dehydrogenase (short-subunit alcohol dehydrogenase family)
MSHHFIKLLGGQENGRIINITSAAGPFVMPGTDSYGLSKLLQLQMQRYIAISNPNVFAASLQPGAILTGITKLGFERFSKDTPALAGGAAVWLASPESDFVNGRYSDATWDVTEIIQRKDEIVNNGLLRMELQGDFTKGLLEH